VKVLVTGATGYVGGRLVPRLLEEGHAVRTTTTRPAQAGRWWSDAVETVEMDIADPDQVDAAVAGVEAVYYLVHGLGGEGFVERDREAARNVARAVERHGVGRVVYLSGIVPPVDPADLSDHITSRHEVERILAESPATTITLRAAVLVGSGSTSFEIIRQVSERLPVQTVPTWLDSDVQPIAVVDVIEALVGALTVESESRSYDIGGAERLRYAALLDRYAAAAGIGRPQVAVPLLPTDLVGHFAGGLVDVPDSTVVALVESLHHDMVSRDEAFRDDLLPEGYALVDLDEALRRSLARPGEAATMDPGSADPMGPLPQDPSWAGGGEDRPLVERAANAVRDVTKAVRGPDRP
jgi:uncharacterized protein YbjT (DUF2867 family)